MFSVFLRFCFVTGSFIPKLCQSRNETSSGCYYAERLNLSGKSLQPTRAEVWPFSISADLRAITVAVRRVDDTDAFGSAWDAGFEQNYRRRRSIG